MPNFIGLRQWPGKVVKTRGDVSAEEEGEEEETVLGLKTLIFKVLQLFHF